MSAQPKQNEFSDDQSSAFVRERQLARIEAKRGKRKSFSSNHSNIFDDYMSHLREVEALSRHGETLIAIEMEKGREDVLQTLLSSRSALLQILNIPRELRLKTCSVRDIFDDYEKPDASSKNPIGEETIECFNELREKVEKLKFTDGSLDPVSLRSVLELVEACNISFSYFESLALTFIQLHQDYLESKRALERNRRRCFVSDEALAKYCDAFCDRQAIDWTTCPLSRRSLVDYLFAKTNYHEFVKGLQQKYSLTPEQLEGLVTKLSEAYRRYEAAKSEMTSANLGLVVSIAKKFANKGIDMMDLVQEGSLGLIRAVEKFEYQRGHKFSTYASWWVRQAICRAIFEQSHTIRIPTHLAEVVKLIKRATAKLEHTNGRLPTLEEISEETGVEVDRIAELQSVSQKLVSFNDPINEDDRELGDLIEDPEGLSPEEEFMNASGLQEITDTILSSLSPREEKIIRMRYGIGERSSYTLDDIGRNFNLTRERIRQIEAMAIEKMRQAREFEELSELIFA